jgi:anti-anti-sigma factor
MSRVGVSREAAVSRARLRVIPAVAGGAAPPVLELEGEFDLDNVPEIDRFLRRNLGPLYHQRHLVIDLARTTFIDSSFVAFLLKLWQAQRAEGRELLLARPGGQVRRVFGLLGLHNVVPVFDSAEAAADSVMVGRPPVIPPTFRPSGL